MIMSIGFVGLNVHARKVKMCEIPTIYHVILLLLYILLEAWLGKTKKIEANSILELIMNIIKEIIKLLQRR
jgi:hypothetical protein